MGFPESFLPGSGNSRNCQTRVATEISLSGIGREAGGGEIRFGTTLVRTALMSRSPEGNLGWQEGR